MKTPLRRKADGGSSGGLDVTSAGVLGGAKMDASRAREHLRRRYLFPPDAEAPVDGESSAGPGEALPRARSELRPGSRSRGPGKRPARGPPAALPSQEGPGFIFRGLPNSLGSRVFGVIKDP